jgi:glycosyltransferase involved in cell wall biosynthesis
MSPKKILILHNTYQQAGGEEAVVDKESKLLKEYGHEVFLHSVSNDSIIGFWSKAVTALRTPYSQWGRKEATRMIHETRPELVHVHNFFPLLTPSIYDACLDAGVPVVQTLHNYRTICAGALLMREGKPCEDCIQGVPYKAVLHSCYRNSRLGSLVVARMIDTHRRQKTWESKVDRFIALTEFSKKKFVEAGFPSSKIAVKPNFSDVTIPEESVDSDRKGALFVGRLNQEKGLVTLIHAWQNLDVPLRIIGDGPLMDWMRGRISESTVTIAGRKEPTQVVKEMARASYMVMPSECYENFPLALAEAFAQGLAVIASRLGAMGEIIEDGITGLHFNAGDAEDLARKVRWANAHPEAMRHMGNNALRIYEENYTPEINYHQLMNIYREALKEKRGEGVKHVSFQH